jgi:hypothetical protein
MAGNMEYIYNMEGIIDKLNMRLFKRKTRLILSLVYQQFPEGLDSGSASAAGNRKMWN